MFEMMAGVSADVGLPLRSNCRGRWLPTKKLWQIRYNNGFHDCEEFKALPLTGDNITRLLNFCLLEAT
jgi:hypothetical protein